jgi:DNA polymerase-1
MPEDLRYQITSAKEFCQLAGIPFLNIPEVEADDAMGSIAKWAESTSITTYLCSSDKDLYQLVNDKILMLNTRKDNLIIGCAEVEEIFGVPPRLIVDLLSMTGDSSDNVPGIPGIGGKTAAALLNQFGSLDSLLANPSQINGDKKRDSILAHVDMALLSKRLVTLDLAVDIPRIDSFYKRLTPSFNELKEFYSSMSFHTLMREMETARAIDGPVPEQITEKVENEYLLIDDEIGLQNLLQFLSSQKEICFDTETTSIQSLQAEIVGIGFCIHPGKAWYIPTNGSLSRSHVLQAIKPLFENAQIGFYGHNVKYDYHILANYGIYVANICFDTIIASYLLNSHNRQHSLETLALQYFSKVTIPITALIGKGKNEVSMMDVPIKNVCEYCCEDVDYTCRLKKILEDQLDERGLTSLMQTIELPLLEVLVKMERYGIFLDIPCLQALSKDIYNCIDEVQQKIYALAGETFNLNSPKQLSHILQHKLNIVLPKKTATGFSTNAEVLESIKEQHPIAEALLEYRTLEKLRSTYLENLPIDVNPKTKRIHCTFNQSVAATGRLSCQDPNLQNIPTRTTIGSKIREAFRPQLEGWTYLAADYSQIELRLLAHFSEDPNLIQAFKNGEDIHAHTAAIIFNIPLSNVTKEQRDRSKAVNFGILYGQQAFGLAKELRIDIKEAAAFIEMYFKRFPHVKNYIEQSKQIARETGKAITYSGRQRLIPEINSKNVPLKMLAERLAVNTPIQGTAADLIKLAMLKINKELVNKKLQGYMILQIHDELIFEVPQTEVDVFTPLVKDAMENVYSLKIPLIVDIALGKNWKEC